MKVGEIRVLHYLNQFFAGRGGEDAAAMPVTFVEGSIGPGRLVAQRLGTDGTVIGTVISGDAFVAERGADATAAFADLLEIHQPDVVIAGPAFESGRYGMGCIRFCNAAVTRGISAVAGLHPTNPALGLRIPGSYIVPTGSDVTGMRDAVVSLVRLAVRLGRGIPLGPAADEGYLPTGDRRPVVRPEPGHTRALAMLLAKIHGRPFRTEMAPIWRSPATATSTAGRPAGVSVGGHHVRRIGAPGQPRPDARAP